MQVTPRVWTIAGHIDATSRDIAPYEIREVADLQGQMPAANALVVDVRRKPDGAWHQRAAALGHAAPCLTTVGVSAAAAVMIGSPVGAICMGVLGLAGAALNIPLLKLSRTMWRGASRKLHDEPRWTGTRTFDLTGSPRAGGRIQAPVLQSSSSTRAPSAETLAQRFASTFRHYPSYRTMVLIGGHGDAYKSVAGMSVDEVAKTLQLTHEQTGRPVDLVVLEACMMGNLEALRKIQGHARFAVVSEDTMGASGLPWSHVLPRLGQIPLGASHLGAELVRSCKGNINVPTLSLVDLSKVEPLAQAVENLARTLHASNRKEVRKAFRQALREPQTEGWLDKKMDGLADLGSLLDRLQQNSHDGQVHSAVMRTRLALQDAVLTHRSTSVYKPTSGVSVQVSTPTFLPHHYADETGMQAWSSLVQSLRPWPSRMVSFIPDQLSRLFD